jgi:pyruvate dehydrogenase E2 component (dihydrolipoamide acetyltransferase)
MNVLMPQLGETVAEGKITKWLKSAGEAIKPGDNLFEIETDKVSMEVPSTVSGVLSEIRVPEGEIAPVGAVVAVIADGADAGPAADDTPGATPSLAKGSPAPAAPPPAQPRDARPVTLDPFFEVRTPARNFGPARLPGGVAVTPLARRLAAERGIDLSAVHGSGSHGRIVAADIESAALAPQRPPAARLDAGTAAEIKALYATDSYVEVPLDGMRRTIAARLTQAQTVPHFYLAADVDIGRVLALREEVNQSAPIAFPHPAAAAGKEKVTSAFKLSLNDFVIRALALALQRVPAANAVWAGDRILRFRHSDIGVAVALDDGLVAPVIRAAETKSLATISAEIKDLANRAREQKLAPAEWQGGAAAVSNLGMYGVREFSAIINPPHATMLAIGAARRQAVETADGGVAFASLCAATLSCDHRVLDGALAAQLLAAFKAFMEAPARMLV